jgi:hypothetical protein
MTQRDADDQPYVDGDSDSTTGANEATRDEHVGRVAGDDVGYAGETGGERRAAAAEAEAAQKES